IAGSLSGVAADIRILALPNLPAKGDLSDWLDAGGTKEALLNLAATAPPFRQANSAKKKQSRFSLPDPIPASQLATSGATIDWLWPGYIARACTTELIGLWKGGKTTLLAALLKTMECGGDLADLPVPQGKALIISEESRVLWARRCHKLDIGDHVLFQLRPFLGRPDQATWEKAIDRWAEIVAAQKLDLVCVDTLAMLSPCNDENDPARMLEAILPL